ncbi:MAG: MASE1 domain-containing protein, partial [Thermoanaerobaculia bacterium]
MASAAPARTISWFVGSAALAAAYFGAARLSLALPFAEDNVTAIWPPTGIALAALVLYGRRLWPGVVAGALLVNASAGTPPAAAVVIAFGDTLEALAAVTLLRGAADFRP